MASIPVLPAEPPLRAINADTTWRLSSKRRNFVRVSGTMAPTLVYQSGCGARGFVGWGPVGGGFSNQQNLKAPRSQPSRSGGPRAGAHRGSKHLVPGLRGHGHGQARHPLQDVQQRLQLLLQPLQDAPDSQAKPRVEFVYGGLCSKQKQQLTTPTKSRTWFRPLHKNIKPLPAKQKVWSLAAEEVRLCSTRLCVGRVPKTETRTCSTETKAAGCVVSSACKPAGASRSFACIISGRKIA